MQNITASTEEKNTIGENLDLLDSINQLVASADKQRNPRIRKGFDPFLGLRDSSCVKKSFLC